MSCLQTNFSVYDPNCTDLENQAGSGCSRVSSTMDTVKVNPATMLKIKNPKSGPVTFQVQPSLKSQKWWEKSLQPNMTEIQSPDQVVDLLRNAGDNLVVVIFYSPGCGGCRTLHPKICQVAGMSPYTHFVTVNYEQHREMCHVLNVHVLPFFKFYGGGEGKLCSFSCTNATIKKFKDALCKHAVDQPGHGPAKGLEEGEIASLASLGLLPRDHMKVGMSNHFM